MSVVKLLFLFLFCALVFFVVSIKKKAIPADAKPLPGPSGKRTFSMNG
jgi:hypothetical protein